MCAQDGPCAGASPAHVLDKISKAPVRFPAPFSAAAARHAQARPTHGRRARPPTSFAQKPRVIGACPPRRAGGHVADVARLAHRQRPQRRCGRRRRGVKATGRGVADDPDGEGAWRALKIGPNEVQRRLEQPGAQGVVRRSAVAGASPARGVGSTGEWRVLRIREPGAAEGDAEGVEVRDGEGLAEGQARGGVEPGRVDEDNARAAFGINYVARTALRHF